ncbi:MAG: ParB/RepB/Spo0J family partition protein [Pseudomonadales bacterium]|nr:ParB/RepB/Spo0J family partition protein [Pseudomonadales bacterium]
MTVKKRGLGRGLDALIGATGVGRSAEGEAGAAQTDLRQLPIDLVRRGRYQPRRDFNEEALQELANSIRSQGLIQPIVVRPVGIDQYEIVAGERRWRAAQLAGMSEIPALVRDVPDESAIAMALIENIQREDLNAIEEAVALARLQQEFGLTHEQIAEAVGKSRTTVTNIMRLLGLQPEVRGHLEARRLEMGHGRALLALSQHQQIEAARDIVEKGLSVRATEALVRRLLNPPAPALKPAAQNADIRRLERELSETIGAKLAIEHRKGGKGRLVIDYSSLEQLDGILGYFRVS